MTSSDQPQPTLTSPLLRADEVAEFLRVPRSSVYEYVRTGQIPHIRIGRHIRFCQHQLADWVAGQQPRAAVDDRRPVHAEATSNERES